MNKKIKNCLIITILNDRFKALPNLVSIIIIKIRYDTLIPICLFSKHFFFFQNRLY